MVISLIQDRYLGETRGGLGRKDAGGLELSGLLRHPSGRPLVLAIAGDSGSGKDTLSDALGQVLGEQSTSALSGDNYHSWDRHSPMWRAFTHLNPAANDLERFARDIMALGRGAPVRTPHYDHRVGRMSKPELVESRDVIIVSGLHALFLPELNPLFDLKIYLAMDEQLRHFFKIRRDVLHRGHDVERARKTLERRESDSARYIRPQMANADLIFALEPTDRRQLEDPLSPVTRAVQMRLKFKTSSIFGPNNLARALLGVAGLSVSLHKVTDGRNETCVYGHPSSEDIAMAGRRIMPRVASKNRRPNWRDGLIGVMQLVVMDQLFQRMNLPRW